MSVNELVNNMEKFIMGRIVGMPAARSTFIINKEFNAGLGRYEEVPERDTQFFAQLKVDVNNRYKDYIDDDDSIKLSIEGTHLAVRFHPKHTTQDIILRISLMPEL